MNRRSLLLGLPLALAAGAARAQGAWAPSRPVVLVVPFAPGGGTDIGSRIVAQKLSEQFKQQFVVENRAGAGGAIGMDAVAKAAPDGHTITINVNSTLTLPHFFKIDFVFVKTCGDVIQD